jgi:hypothetical protein
MSLSDAEKLRRFEKVLKRAGDTHTVEDVVDKIHEGRAQCWANGDSLVVTEVLVYPRLRACNYWIALGDLHECSDLQADIDAWAAGEGCSIATATGRMGWLRLARTPLGGAWRPRAVQFIKPLQGSAR